LGDAQFIAELEAFVAGLAEADWINSLAQTLIKLTAPGVPDTYQGTELWDFSLVDPDNRRPVDFALRRRLLNEVPRLSVEEIWRRRGEGLPKLWVMRQALALRRRHPEWFDAYSRYVALQPNGEKAQHVVAFRRGGAITVVPRLLVSLSRPMAGNGSEAEQGTLGVTRVDWGDTGLELPAGTWRNELTGEPVERSFVRLGNLLAQFPVALLTQEEID
jgi:(1->4)-alpha-D-glucan 1-alpha-D-glucosylmutase